jgi:hypothetical protein
MGTDDHALLWSGTNAVTDLHPAGFTWSLAAGVGDGEQVGHGVKGNSLHALLWNGSNDAIDLQPVGFASSSATATSNGKQVGWGSGIPTGNKLHALLWYGSNSATDLNPVGYAMSEAHGTNGEEQVGWGYLTAADSRGHALLWNDTADAVDLSSLLPANFSESYAYTLDASRDVFGVALDVNNNWHAVAWVVNVPEPIAMPLFSLVLTILRKRRRTG